MNHDTQFTSVLAHGRAVRSGKKQTYRERIILYLETYGPRTRNELAVELDIRINCVCGPVKVGLDSGLLRLVGERKDAYTGELAQLVDVVPAVPTQMELPHE